MDTNTIVTHTDEEFCGRIDRLVNQISYGQIADDANRYELEAARLWTKWQRSEKARVDAEKASGDEKVLSIIDESW